MHLRKTFARRGEAQTAAELMRIERTNFGTAALSNSDKLRVDALEASSILEPHNVSLSAAARFYADHLAALKKGREVEAVAADYLAGAKADGRSKRQLSDIKGRLGRFTRDFQGCTLAEVSTTDVEDWLRSLGELAPSSGAAAGKCCNFSGAVC